MIEPVTSDSAAALLLTNRLTDVDAEPLKAREYWEIVDRIAPGRLLETTEPELNELVGDPALRDRIGHLLDAGTAFAIERERLESSGIRMLSSFDDDYPPALRDCLGDAAPPVLYVAGPVGWLHQHLIGVVGSRAVDEAEAAVARQVAQVAAAAGFGIVSGGAEGVDLISMDAAHEAEIPSVGVTAEGLERASRRKDLRSAVAEERLCLASPFAPGAGFTVGNAMGRNKLIYALATVTLVVASDLDSGGTWAGATEALRRRFGAVAVWMGDGAGEGNDALVDRGAIEVDDLAAWNPAGVDALERPPQATQLGFGLDG